MLKLIIVISIIYYAVKYTRSISSSKKKNKPILNLKNLIKRIKSKDEGVTSTRCSRWGYCVECGETMNVYEDRLGFYCRNTQCISFQIYVPDEEG